MSNVHLHEKPTKLNEKYLKLTSTYRFGEAAQSNNWKMIDGLGDNNL